MHHVNPANFPTISQMQCGGQADGISFQLPIGLDRYGIDANGKGKKIALTDRNAYFGHKKTHRLDNDQSQILQDTIKYPYPLMPS